MPYTFIHDIEQVRKFHSLLSPLKEDEAYFISMSARNKYLTAEERAYYDLGRKEMFDRKLVKETSFECFLRELRTFEVNDGGYTGRSNIPIPEKCMVIYANINPVSGILALREFYEKTNTILFEMGSNKSINKKFSCLDSELLNCYQRAHGTSTLIDIDCDIPDDGADLVKTVCDDLREHDVVFNVMKTRSGYHILIQRDTLTYNYKWIIENVNAEAVQRYERAEIMVNRNQMVPCPGTISAGHKVVFVDM